MVFHSDIDQDPSGDLAHWGPYTFLKAYESHKSEACKGRMAACSVVRFFQGSGWGEGTREAQTASHFHTYTFTLLTLETFSRNVTEGSSCRQTHRAPALDASAI